MNDHTHHAISGSGHTHAIVDADYVPPNCRCSLKPIRLGSAVREELQALRQEMERDAHRLVDDAQEWDDAARFPLVSEPGLTRFITVSVKLQTRELEEITRRMRESIAAAVGLPARLLAGDEPVIDDAREREGRALLMVAPFPHTPE